MSMSMQGLGVFLLAVIAAVGVLGVVLMVRTAASVRRAHEQTHQVLSGRDLGPALHGLMQQTRELNRQLTNIDKRLEKLEALQKVQIANLTFRDDAVRQRRQQ
jgi:uncharacterized protein YecT (DUF1311 family)